MRPGVFLRYYSSTDDTITTGDNQVGRSPVRALNAGGYQRRGDQAVRTGVRRDLLLRGLCGRSDE